MATTTGSVVVDSRTTTPFLDLTVSPILPTPSFDGAFAVHHSTPTMDLTMNSEVVRRGDSMTRRLPTPFSRMSLPLRPRSPATPRPAASGSGSGSEASPRRRVEQGQIFPGQQFEAGEQWNSHAGSSSYSFTMNGGELDQVALADNPWVSPPPVVPQRRRREVIDVDSLDDDDVGPSTRPIANPPRLPLQTRAETRIYSEDGPPPAQRRRILPPSPSDIIYISDDEDAGDAAPQPVAAGPSRPRHGRSGLRLFSPPPPPPSAINIPPVPAVPGPLRQFQSIPLRRRIPLLPPSRAPRATPGPSAASTSSAGPVRPLDEPYEFEAALLTPRVSNSNTPTRSWSPPMRAAAPSHHVPSMGLGGALISTHREHMRRERSRNSSGIRRLYERMTSYVPTVNFLAIGGLPNIDEGDESMEVQLRDIEAIFGEDRQARLSQGPFGDMEWNYDAAFNWALGRPKRPEMEYRPEYTHKKPAETGFSYDFAPEPTESPTPKKKPVPLPPKTLKSSASNPIIIDDDDDDLFEDQPAPAKDKGKGKAKEEDFLHDALQTPEAGPSRALQAESTLQAEPQPPSPKVVFKTLLVCASCNDPLVLNSGHLKGEEEQHKRRIWGLRCGHMIDGKCLEKISRPQAVEVLPEPEPEASTSESKGKGKAVDKMEGNEDGEAEGDADLPDSGEHAEAEEMEGPPAKRARKGGKKRSSRKGKGRGRRAPLPPSETDLPTEDAAPGGSSLLPQATNTLPPISEVLGYVLHPDRAAAVSPEPIPLSSRPRLRPRNPITGLATVPGGSTSSPPSSRQLFPAASSSSPSSIDWSSQLPIMDQPSQSFWDSIVGPRSIGSSSAQTKRKRKGKAKVRAPKIEETYRWMCPVPNCGREHTSLKIDGVWIQEKEQGTGAIQVFV